MKKSRVFSDWLLLIQLQNRFIKSKKNQGVNYYLLNCDYQENWNLTAAQKKDLGIKI